MKKLHNIVLICLLAAVAVMLAACTGNDHTPMPWMGSWDMTSMTVDGKESAEVEPHTTVWEFQNDIVEISLLDAVDGVATTRTGTWKVDGRRLSLNYTHSQTGVAAGTGDYSAPQWLLMQQNAVLQLDILRLDRRDITLQYVTPKGQTVVYTLHKTW